MRLSEIQRVNRDRANRWHGGDFKSWSGLEWAGAMCGEAGAAANVCKKLKRVEDALDGNAFSERPLVPEELRAKLAGECADVLLYLCLLASRYDIDLGEAVVATFNKKSIEMKFPERLTDDEPIAVVPVPKPAASKYDWHDLPKTICPKCQQKKVQGREIDNDHQDWLYTCGACGHGWAVDGPDA